MVLYLGECDDEEGEVDVEVAVVVVVVEVKVVVEKKCEVGGAHAALRAAACPSKTHLQGNMKPLIGNK